MKSQDANGEESIRLSKDGSDHKNPIAIAENGMIDMNWTRDRPAGVHNVNPG